MSLLELLDEEGIRSTTQLANTLNTSVEMVEAKLERYERLGYVKKIVMSADCGGNCKSATAAADCGKVLRLLCIGKGWKVNESYGNYCNISCNMRAWSLLVFFCPAVDWKEKLL